MNLLAQAHSQLNAETLSPLAEQLGIDLNQLSPLIEKALPALFAIFQKTAADSEKANLVGKFLQETDASILQDPAAALAEHGPQLTRGGKSGLAQLLGPQLTDYIAPLAQATQLGEGKIATTLGTLAPFVIAHLGQHAQDANELQALLSAQEIAAPKPDQKLATKEEKAEKSYLPDPNKKREKRPFPKRKAILLALVLALVAALLFWLIDSGVLPLGQSAPAESETLIEDSHENFRPKSALERSFA